MCTTVALRFEHIFRDSDRERYRAIEMTRARDALITALNTDSTHVIDASTSYEALLSSAIKAMHQRAHRTSLEHQPSFEWNGHVSPCWYYEWTSVMYARYHAQREQASALFEGQSYQDAKQMLVNALESVSRAKDILSTWVWQAPKQPSWCRQAWWDAQEEETKAMRAMSIYLHCENLEEATMQQLYGASSKAEEHATTAASIWPTSQSLAMIENARVKRAWCKAHLLWDEGQYGAAIGLAQAWSDISFESLAGVARPEWEHIIHDWSHENNTVHYQKISTPTSI